LLALEKHVSLTLERLEQLLAVKAELDEHVALSDNLRATQERCTELLEENRQLARDKRVLVRVLEACKLHIEGELERGYVLTDERAAGVLWRMRWNEVLGEVEQALTKASK
jgi:hypothetical protein